MALPGNLTTREIIGQYVDLAGAPLTGTVEFTIEPILADGSAGVVIIPTPLIAELDSEGKFSKVILTTDDPDVNPTGFRYKVVEKFTGASGRMFFLDVPGDSQIPIDLSQIVVPGEPTDGQINYVNQGALDAEQTARIQGDADTLASAKTYTDEQLATPSDVVRESTRNQPDGFAGLDLDAKVLAAQLRLSDVASSSVADGASAGASTEISRADHVHAGVALAGVQSIAGRKTFTDPAVVRSAVADALLMIEQTDLTATAGVFKLIGGNATNAVFLGRGQEHTANAWAIRANGTFEIGDGTGGRDCVLSRNGPNDLSWTANVKCTEIPTDIAHWTRKDYVDAGDAAAVKNTGDETIEGYKTFQHGIDVATTAEAVRFRATTSEDMSLTSTGHGFQVGLDTGTNMRMDTNEIQVLTDGVTEALFVQPEGGSVGFFTSRAAGSTFDTFTVRGALDAVKATSETTPVDPQDLARKDYVDSVAGAGVPPDTFQELVEKDQPGGYAGLDANGNIASSAHLFALTDTIAPVGLAASQGGSGAAARGDHVHPVDDQWTPEDVGMAAWTFDPSVGQSTPMYSDDAVRRFALLKVHRNITVNNVVWHFTGYAGDTTGSGLNTGSWAGVYDFAGNLLESTIDLGVSNWLAAGVHNPGGKAVEAPLLASLTLSPGMYYILWAFSYDEGHVNGNAGPMLLAAESTFSSPPNTFGPNNIQRWGWQGDNTATSPPNPLLVSNYGEGSNRYWAGLS